jgi:hypothetical protein
MFQEVEIFWTYCPHFTITEQSSTSAIRLTDYTSSNKHISIIRILLYPGTTRTVLQEYGYFDAL